MQNILSRRLLETLISTLLLCSTLTIANSGLANPINTNVLSLDAEGEADIIIPHYPRIAA